MSLALGQDQSQSSPDYCVSMIQSVLLQSGRISPADRTGYMNDRTNYALTLQYGNGWQNFPGGLCALATAGAIAPMPGYGAYGYNPYAYGAYGATSPMTPLLLLGGAALVLVLLLKK